ncbi:MAG: InlB B-repeat-containing protein [Clostridia bacterium]|nr:InlB B-repeat-containing protein [Clostridia bacterium]
MKAKNNINIRNFIIFLIAIVVTTMVPMNVFATETSGDVSVVSTDSKYISNIRWGLGTKKGTLYWDAYEGASYYVVSCGNRTNVKVTKTSYDFSTYLKEKGIYKASIVGYGNDGCSMTYVCYSPEYVLDYNSYTIKCYLTENDGSPITTSTLSLNKGYTLKQYTYTDKDENFQLEEPTLENYDFVGWSVAGSTSTQNPVMITADTGNKTYIARWQGKRFNVAFDAQGGVEVVSKQVKYGSFIGSLPTTTRENYIFDGWYTAINGGTLASSLDKMPAYDFTYYAHWSPINYTIDLLSVEDDVTYLRKQISYNVESEDIVLPEITREGYFFDGWTGEGIDEPKKGIVISSGSTGTKKFYANWTVNPCAYQHTYENVIIPATVSENGKIIPTCKNCNKTKTFITVSKIRTVTLSNTKYVYDGKVKLPTVSIKDATGKLLKNNVDYAVLYNKNKNVGTATVKIILKGKYRGTINREFKIVPKGTTIKSLYPESEKITIKWNKQKAQTSGYQIEYTWPAKVATSKIVTVKGNTITSKGITKLKNNKDYYVRIRTYKDVEGRRYYSSWTKMKKVHVDKVQLSNKKNTLYRGQAKKLSLKYIPLGAKVTWKSSNKKIATVSSSGRVTAKGLGKTTVLAKYKGKTYKATINVSHMKPSYGATLCDYNTRNNYFTVKIKNNSSKTMTILSGTTTVKDADYKSLDRKVYLSKSYTIKPGKMKTIKFKVKGQTTWYDFTDFTLYYNFKVDGKIYYAKTNSGTMSKYKNASKWKNSYSNIHWFEDFVMEAFD